MISADPQKIVNGLEGVRGYLGLGYHRNSKLTDEEYRDANTKLDVAQAAAKRAQEEIEYWRDKFFTALEELKGTHVNVYRYTLGREPSPHERDHVIGHLNALRKEAENDQS